MIVIKIFFNVFLFFREREKKRERGKERGRHRIQSRLQALSHQHRAQHRAWTHELWDHDLSWNQTLNWLSHPGTPLCAFKIKSMYVIFSNDYLFLRERARGGKGQKERETQNPKQAPRSELSAESQTRGLNSWAVRSWPELKSDT